MSGDHSADDLISIEHIFPIVERFIHKAWNQDNDAIATELTAPPPSAAEALYSYQGSQGILDFIHEYRKIFPKTQLFFNKNDMVITGDRVVVPVTARGGVKEHDFVLFLQISSDHIISMQISPTLEWLKFLYVASMKLGARAGFFTQSYWDMPLCRSVLLVLGILIVMVGLMAHLENRAYEIEFTWLDNEFYYLKLPQKAHRQPTVSADGNKVVFASANDNLVANDTNGVDDVFLYLRDPYTVTRISLVGENGQSNGWSSEPGITADGRYVIFQSAASLTNAQLDPASPINVFVRDLECKQTYRLKDIFADDRTFDLERGGYMENDECDDPTAAKVNIALSLNRSPDVMPVLWWTQATQGERQRLHQQQERALGLAERHLEVVMYYYQQLFVAISMATLSVIIGTICLVEIGRSGWAGTSPYVRIVFTVMFASSIFFGTLPNIFAFPTNIDANKKAFIAAMALENQIVSYTNTGKVLLQSTTTGSSSTINASGTPTGTVELPASEFIIRADSQLVELFALPVELNADNIPEVQEIISQLQGEAKQE